jgi:two-component system cell cycle sensor histidine kinase/response regulator CckA
MNAPFRILVVDDSESDAALLIHEFRRQKIPVESRRVDDEPSLRAALRSEQWSAILCDWSMPSFSALGALGVVKELGLDVPFLVVSGTIGEEMAVEAVRSGAHDYLLKDRLTRLVPAVEREIRQARARSDRRQLEAQLFQAQKMDALGRLAGGIAHDFNNILMIILSEADLLRQATRRGADVTEHVDGITNAAQRAASLTSQLLTVSRRQPRNPRRIAPNAVVEDVKKLLDRILGEDIQVTTALSANVPAIEADPEQIGQVLLNLAVNARDAMPGGGKLSIGTKRVELDDTAAADTGAGIGPGIYTELTISDTGSGMDGATLARIFEPFFTTKEVGKGTGLGLSMVFSIVRQSGGGIAVQSAPHQGATFRLYFPATDLPAEASTPSESPPRSGGAHTTVLVVDDDAQVRKAVCRLLTHQGFTAIEATDAPAAVEIFRERADTIGVVMTDLVMPDMNGRVLAQRLRELRPDVKMLFMSGFADHSALAGDPADEDNLILYKPFTGAEIAAAVRKALGSGGGAR